VGVGFSTDREEGPWGCERNGKPGRNGSSGAVLILVLFIGKSGTKPLDEPRNWVLEEFNNSDRGVEGVPYAFRFGVISSDWVVFIG
jgi:hypothetical protein